MNATMKLKEIELFQEWRNDDLEKLHFSRQGELVKKKCFLWFLILKIKECT